MNIIEWIKSWFFKKLSEPDKTDIEVLGDFAERNGFAIADAAIKNGIVCLHKRWKTTLKRNGIRQMVACRGCNVSQLLTDVSVQDCGIYV